MTHWYSYFIFCRYAIPLIQKILGAKQLAESAHSSARADSSSGHVRALVLVPSKELSQQAASNMKVLRSGCIEGDTHVVCVCRNCRPAALEM